jgi:hypothetical protein
MMTREQRWNYCRWTVLALAAILITGCEDPGSYGEVKPVIPDRVVVFNTTAEPPSDNPRDPIWDEVPRYGITVGDPDSAFTHDFGKFRVILQAIKSPSRLYLRVEWLDPDMDTIPEYLFRSRQIGRINTIDIGPPLVTDTVYDYFWLKRTAFSADSTGIDVDNDTIIDYYLVDNTGYDQDRFAIMWDVGDNGTEAANCALMCHAPGDTSILGHRMYTNGGGHVDVWHWQVATSDPLQKARDEYWSGLGREFDQYVSPLAFKNVDTVATKPLFVHRDTTAFNGAYLHSTDAREYTAAEDSIDWPIGFEVPGFILNDQAAGSIADVSSFSMYFKNIGIRYVVLLSRDMQSNIIDDIDFTGVMPGDSVMATIAVMNNASQLHSGSAPFYIVFPE